jgi:hypothetical protein
LNVFEAIPWLRKAADQGSVEAMNNLGVAFEHGLGVQRDFSEAAKWYRAAAIRGDAQAQANIGLLYRFGQGVNKDLPEAYAWFKLSAEKGNPLGDSNFSELQSLDPLTPAQLNQAERRLTDLRWEIAGTH